MLRVDWDEWGRALDVFMWQAVSLTIKAPQDLPQQIPIREWPPASVRLIGFLGPLAQSVYVPRMRKATHGFRGVDPVALVSPYPGNPEWRVVSLPEFGGWAGAQGWELPEGFPWAAAPLAGAQAAAPPGQLEASSAQGNQTRWSTERLAELRDFHAQQGASAAAGHFGISVQRVGQLLRRQRQHAAKEVAQPTAHVPFPPRKG